jgi:hypothetical protein
LISVIAAKAAVFTRMSGGQNQLRRAPQRFPIRTRNMAKTRLNIAAIGEQSQKKESRFG